MSCEAPRFVLVQHERPVGGTDPAEQVGDLGVLRVNDNAIASGRPLGLNHPEANDNVAVRGDRSTAG